MIKYNKKKKKTYRKQFFERIYNKSIHFYIDLYRMDIVPMKPNREIFFLFSLILILYLDTAVPSTSNIYIYIYNR